MKSIHFLNILIILLLGSCFGSNDKLVEEFYPDGTIKSETQVKNGMRNGVKKAYDEKGRLISTTDYVDDNHEGWLTKYNPENGKITAKAHYHDNKQDGPVTLYYKGGELYRESYYKEGHIDSIVKTYWPDGKLLAEGFYKMSMPALGLKEYDKQGNLVKQPKIVVEEINRIAFDNRVILKIHLSNNTAKADFYIGALKEGKYLDDMIERLYDKDGVATLSFYVPQHTSLMKQINIIAKCNTDYNNVLLIQKTYNLAVSN